MRSTNEMLEHGRGDESSCRETAVGVHAEAFERTNRREQGGRETSGAQAAASKAVPRSAYHELLVREAHADEPVPEELRRMTLRARTEPMSHPGSPQSPSGPSGLG